MGVGIARQMILLIFPIFLTLMVGSTIIIARAFGTNDTWQGESYTREINIFRSPFI